MKLLIIGDVVGKPGRNGLAKVLPVWKEKYNPSLVLANVENLTHGKGVAPKTLAELDLLGIDAYTSGNHVLDQKDLSISCFANYPNLIRPANYMGAWPGKGWCRIIKNTLRITDYGLRIGNKELSEENDKVNFLIINLGGKVFFNEEKFGGIKNPFWAVDEILANVAKKDDIILVDFHAEATSEKSAMGWHLDERVSLVYGTHQHVPTSDERVLPKGTGFVTDIGMTGPLNSVIGADKEIALNSYLDPQIKFKMQVPESGPVIVRGMLVELADKKALSLKRLEQVVEI